MRILIHGCGVIGTLVGNLLTAQGHDVLGIRRHPGEATSESTPDGVPTAGFPLVAGDAADPGLHARLGPADAVLLAANPGLRARSRGSGSGGNRLAEAAALLVRHHPAARLVYTGTTSVYADAAGAWVDESGALAMHEPEVAALLAIEQAVLTHPRALVLRVAALVGPTRNHARKRIRAAADTGQPVVVAGDPDRPFSFVHEQDLAELCAFVVVDGTWTGIRNVAATAPRTVRDYYESLAWQLGIRVAVEGDGRNQPSRRVRSRPEIAERLRRSI